jgi:RimJ/RimL family protein N-acetyltransferase
MNIQLFEGERIRLAPIDPEKDAETISKWMHDPEYLRLTSPDPAKPLAPSVVKKKLEEQEKEDELNLHRLGANTFEYNAGALRFLERHGFVVEVRRRQGIHRDGRRWDVLYMGLLREEWQPSGMT